MISCISDYAFAALLWAACGFGTLWGILIVEWVKRNG